MTPSTVTPPSFRYSHATLALHWLMAALMVAVFLFIELKGMFPKGSEPREFMKAMHFSLGLSVLGLLVLRLAARFSGPKPPTVPSVGMQTWLHRAAAAGHLALYAWMVAMPLLGWLTLSAAGKPIALFGLQLPTLVAASNTLAHDLKEVHEEMGELGYWLIGLHVAAALFHQHVLKDGLLSRMGVGRPVV